MRQGAQGWCTGMTLRDGMWTEMGGGFRMGNICTLVAPVVKNLPANQETRAQFLDQEDPLDKGMVTHSSNLSWKIPWAEEPGGLQTMGSQNQI